ncbi:peroxisomal membrane protein pex32, partial [Sarracenia purpurea var. burkii]
MWEFWRRHRRKAYLTLGVLGSGYLLYKLYNAHKRRLSELEKELAIERENEELIKAQLQAHFENIQRIADTTTLPHSMLYLSNRVAKELDISHLTERLIRGKDDPNTMTAFEKLELWDRLKIL